LFFLTGIENLTVAKTGVGAPNKKMGIIPAPTEKLLVKP